jgi:hypothetical protein
MFPANETFYPQMGLTAHDMTPIVLAAQPLHTASIVNNKTFAQCSDNGRKFSFIKGQGHLQHTGNIICNAVVYKVK